MSPSQQVSSPQAQEALLAPQDFFPQMSTLRSTDPKFTQGRNKSGRTWKTQSSAANRSCNTQPMHILSWEEKNQRSKEMKVLREQLQSIKVVKDEKRKQQKEQRKLRKKQKEFNEVKSGKFEVIKKVKNISKWGKKLKQQLVKLPAEIFERLIGK